MSETELTEKRDEFFSKRELLREVETDLELQSLIARLEELRDWLLVNDPKFKQWFRQNAGSAESAVSEARAMLKPSVDRAKTMLRTEQSKARALRAKAESETTKWVEAHRIKKIPKDALFCPICREEDKGNTFNGVPFCFKCKHKLVPPSEFKKYNRDYRRNWIKNLKRRGKR